MLEQQRNKKKAEEMEGRNFHIMIKNVLLIASLYSVNIVRACFFIVEVWIAKKEMRRRNLTMLLSM
jgi:hypothetical protein